MFREGRALAQATIGNTLGVPWVVGLRMEGVANTLGVACSNHTRSSYHRRIAGFWDLSVNVANSLGVAC